PDGFTLADLLDANVARSPVLLCGGPKSNDTSADARYGRWPLGFSEVVHAGNEGVNIDRWLAESEAALPRIDFRQQPREAGSWEEVVWTDSWEVRQERAAHPLLVAGATPALRQYIAIAADLLAEIVRETPEVPGHVYRNLAIALGRAGLDTPERRA